MGQDWVFQRSSSCKHPQHQQQQSSKSNTNNKKNSTQQEKPASNSSKKWQKQHKKTTKAVQTCGRSKGQGCSSTQQQEHRGPNAGGSKTEKLRPRGVGPPMEVKHPPINWENCCQHFGKKKTRKAATQQNQNPETVRVVWRGVPRKGPEGWCPEGCGPEVSGPRRVVGANFTKFSFSCHDFCSFFLGGRFVELVVIESRDPQMCMKLPGLHTTARACFRVPAFRDTKERNGGRERGSQSEGEHPNLGRTPRKS